MRARTLVALSLVCAVGVATAAIWSRRVAHEPRRRVGQPSAVLDIQHDSSGVTTPPATTWGTHSIERHRGPGFDYTFAVVEFDDQGFFWDERQLATLRAHLDTLGRRDGFILLTYVHGWNHSAAITDDNVACFQEVLRAVGMMQRQNRGASPRDSVRDPRPVVGVYLGWRGLALSPAWLNKVTFWNRAAAADRVGAGGALLETLLTLREARHTVKPERSKLVIVGHSLGGRAVYGALRPFYTAAVATPRPRELATRPKSVASTGWNIDEPFGDLVVLVNPAFSASAYRTIARRFAADTVSHGSDSHQAPHMLIAASTADEVMGRIYPLSQRVARWFEEAQPDDRSTLFEGVGHHEPFATHELVVASGSVPPRPPTPDVGACSEVRAEELSIVQGSKRSDDLGALFDYERISHTGPTGSPAFTTELRPIAGRSRVPPYMLVRVDSALIPGHNAIFGSGFVDFLIRIVNRATISPEALARLQKRP